MTTPPLAIPPGFLARIIADPADDTSRLVLADWLEDNGNERDAASPAAQACVCWARRRAGLPDLPAGSLP